MNYTRLPDVAYISGFGPGFRGHDPEAPLDSVQGLWILGFSGLKTHFSVFSPKKSPYQVLFEQN